MCCPIGRPNTEVGVGSSNLNFATLWLSCVRFTSLNSLKFSGSMLPTTDNTITILSYLVLQMETMRNWSLENNSCTSKLNCLTWKYKHLCFSLRYINRLQLQQQQQWQQQFQPGSPLLPRIPLLEKEVKSWLFFLSTERCHTKKQNFNGLIISQIYSSFRRIIRKMSLLPKQ